jgi:hypothetical protein
MIAPRRHDLDLNTRAVASAALRQLATRLRRKLPDDKRLAQISVDFDRLAADLERRARP